MEYMIVSDNDPYLMSSNVNALCGRGWVPHGSPMVAATDGQRWFHYQAMIRKTPTTKDNNVAEKPTTNSKSMQNNGYFGIGIERGKTEFNYWTLFRTAQILDASFLFTIGAKFKPGAPDTMCSYMHMPVFSYSDFDDFNNHRPYNCKLVGVELHQDSQDIVTYKHPKRAVYLLGSEDNGLSKIARSHCQELIILPGERSLNVSIAGSIVLYDRVAKNTTSKKG